MKYFCNNYLYREDIKSVCWQICLRWDCVPKHNPRLNIQCNGEGEEEEDKAKEESSIEKMAL